MPASCVDVDVVSVRCVVLVPGAGAYKESEDVRKGSEDFAARLLAKVGSGAALLTYTVCAALVASLCLVGA